MNIILFSVNVTIISFALNSCKASSEKVKQSLEKVPGKGTITHFDVNNQIAIPDSFIIPIEITNDNIIFSRDGKVYVQLKNGHQKFDITQLHQQHRLTGLKSFMQLAK